MWQNFQSLQLAFNPPTQSRRRYSVTADILAYQQCSLQYSAFAVRRYEPALVVQLFYGTIIHQVLDRAHAHYRGELGVPPGTFPTDADIDNYFTQVENALIARRIRAVQSVRDQAKNILKRFNSLEGPTLYPRIIDTECRLQADQGQYILHGNVDVLVASNVGGATPSRSGITRVRQSHLSVTQNTSVTYSRCKCTQTSTVRRRDPSIESDTVLPERAGG